MLRKMKSIYLESSVVSYLAARPSRDLVVAGNQQVTRDWWETRRGECEAACVEFGVIPPTICTPLQLIEA